ncbi:60S ribosomal protein L7-2-like [Punica granatum]|uniref:Uncharacterized protein n=2 Tax=Punica granatum TaxID=22663 RepID=A0A218XAY5_PUNGR|nr:60S ribosomal protein L7-2-like [Punica granatum]OWM81866.1 hypothetical protein CDL15_Pgr007904 [Punica granatum]PKI65982.1 hypothetical protein CRG98_013648 [Punica granatum]
MAEEQGKELAYIPETILKKRKSNEEWALKRKAQLELRQKRAKQSQGNDFKLPEQFIREYRDKELDLIKMKQRTKMHRPAQTALGSKLLFVVRIQGRNDMHPTTKKILNKLRLQRIFSGVFILANAAVMDMLQKVEPYVTYGYPNLKNVKELVYKKGYGRIDKQRVPLTDNNIIEQELGKHGILCMEDIVHEVASVGPHFKEVTRFLWPFALNKPEGGLQKTKRLFRDGGETGNREDHINELIDKMN